MSINKSFISNIAIFSAGIFLIISPTIAISDSSNFSETIQTKSQAPQSKELQPSNYNSVVVVNQKLRSLLEEFARVQDIKLDISPKVKNILVRSQRFSIEKYKFFQQLSSAYSLDFYQRRDEFFISSFKERSSRMINLDNVGFEMVKEELSKLVRNTDDFTFEEISASNSIFVSGPPSYIALVEIVMQGMIKNKTISSDSVLVVKYGVKSSSSTISSD